MALPAVCPIVFVWHWTQAARLSSLPRIGFPQWKNRLSEYRSLSVCCGWRLATLTHAQQGLEDVKRLEVLELNLDSPVRSVPILISACAHATCTASLSAPLQTCATCPTSPAGDGCTEFLHDQSSGQGQLKCSIQSTCEQPCSRITEIVHLYANLWFLDCSCLLL